jgi:hypothetical protein
MPRYALGRLPADPTKPKLRLRRSATERPTPPASVDWLSEVREWGVLGNDSVGDCTAAAAAHVAMLVDKYGQGRDTVITDTEALQMYEAISGYVPGDPATDVGATLQDALDYWRKQGIAGNKIAAFAFVDAQDLDLVRACIATFGSVYTGMSFPSSAMDQLDRGDVWYVVRRSAVEGGHCVPIAAYDADTFTCVTWGRTQPMTVDFYLRYFDEIAVPVDLDWLAATGLSPAGVDIGQLNADYEALTSEPGPFPPAVPVPTPSPEPMPPAPVEPVPADYFDHALVNVFKQWCKAKGL